MIVRTKIKHYIFIVLLFFYASLLKAQAPEFDIARFSPNGHYALILEGNSLDECTIFWWVLFKNEPNHRGDTVVIHKDTAYVLKEALDPHKYKYYSCGNKKTYLFTYQKTPLKDFLASYNLVAKALDQTKNLTIKMDTLATSIRKVPEGKVGKLNDSIDARHFCIGVSYLYNKRKVHTDTISFTARNDFDHKDIIDEIYKQTLKSPKSFFSATKFYVPITGEYFFLKSSFDYYDYNGTLLFKNTEQQYVPSRNWSSYDKSISVFKPL